MGGVNLNYANEQFYKDDYLLGKKAVIDTAFPYYANKASKLIDKATYNRATDIDPVKSCCCELAELLYQYETSKQKQGITSERVDEYSISYAQKDNQALQVEINEIIRSWLANTGLLYCGV